MPDIAPLPPLDQVVWQDPARLNGTPCFTGTRVPLRALFATVRHGHDLDYFLEGFPTVERWQAEAALEYAAQGKFGQYGIGRIARGRWSAARTARR